MTGSVSIRTVEWPSQYIFSSIAFLLSCLQVVRAGVHSMGLDDRVPMTKAAAKSEKAAP
jgi:hypothetical protein